MKNKPDYRINPGNNDLVTCKIRDDYGKDYTKDTVRLMFDAEHDILEIEQIFQRDFQVMEASIQISHVEALKLRQFIEDMFLQ